MSYYLATRSYIESLVGALTQQTNIEFRESDRFGVDVKDKIFYYDPILLKRMTIDEVKGILIHEVGHLNYTNNITKKSKEYKKYPHLASLYNAFEDIRIEHLMVRDLRDFALYPISHTNLWASADNADKINNQGYLKKVDPYNRFVGLMSSKLVYYDSNPLINLSEKDLIYPYAEDTEWYMDNYIEDMAKEFNKYLRKIKAMSTLIKLVDACKNTDEVMEMVDREIVPHIRELLEKHKAPPQEIHGAIGKGKGKKRKGGGKKSKKTFTTAHSIIERLIEGSTTGTKILDPKIPTDGELKQLFKMQSLVLAKHLGSILEEHTTIKYNGAYKRGKLIPRNVYKVRTQEKRLYSRRNNPDTPQYEVTFIVDESGSMQYNEGKRYADAYVSAFIINEACEKLRFKINYVSFDDQVRHHTKISGMRNMAGGGNNENKVLIDVSRKINLDNPNIIFLITDGGVAESNSPTPMLEWFKKREVNVIPLGVGIDQHQQKEFRKWYPTSVIAEDMDDLVTAMAKFLKTIIHR